MFLSPIVFAICYFFSLRLCMEKYKEFGTIFLASTFIRYEILPFSFVYLGEYEGRGISGLFEDEYTLALLLTYYELIICAIVIRYLLHKMDFVTIKSDITFSEKTLIYYIFAALVFGLVLINPKVLLSLSFFLPNKNGYTYDDFSLIEQLTIMLVIVLKQIVFSLGEYKLNSKYSETGGNIYLFFSIILLFFNMSIYFGSNRSDFILMFIASFLYWMYLFKKNNPILIGALAIVGILVVIGITDIRQYYYRYSDQLLNMRDQIQCYFGGIYNVAVSIRAKQLYPNQTNVFTLIYDFARSTLGINFVAKLINMDYANLIFNYTLYGYKVRVSQIMPAIGEGYYCMGFLLSPIVDVIFILIAFRLKKDMSQKFRAEIVYFYIITMMRIGFVMGQNSSIQINDLSFNLFVPLILMWVNDRIAIKSKSRKNGIGNA